jgi:hypothetical protein
MIEHLGQKEHGDDSVESGRQMEHGGRDEVFTTTVAFEAQQSTLNFRDPIVDQRKLLREAGLEPPDDFVLVEIDRPGTRAVGLDDEIDLRESDGRTFRAFRGDRIFTFTVAERGYAWGAAAINETTLRDLASVPSDSDLVLECEDEADQIVKKGAEVDLSAAGVEHFHVRKRPSTFEIVVLYNGQKKPLNVSLSEFIRDVLPRAIALFGPLPNPHTLALFTADKGELNDAWTVQQAGLTPHEQVLLRPSTVKAG